MVVRFLLPLILISFSVYITIHIYMYMLMLILLSYLISYHHQSRVPYFCIYLLSFDFLYIPQSLINPL